MKKKSKELTIDEQLEVFAEIIVSVLLKEISIEEGLKESDFVRSIQIPEEKSR